ncbi:hypothetical protein ACFL5Z_09500 [Planctomycetota bacterium]
MDSIAQAIENSDKSRNQISKETGIDNAVLCRIVTGTGTGSCSLQTVETLCEYFDLELIQKKRKKRKKPLLKGTLEKRQGRR